VRSDPRVTTHGPALPAALALREAQASARLWAWFLVGALLYAQGHGIHLSANSIGNVAPGDVVHLWDEVMGHYVGYAGGAIVTATLAVTMAQRRHAAGIPAYAVALSAGLTWGTNAVGGGTAVASLLVATALATYGWRHRDGLARLLLDGYAPGAVLIAGYLVSEALA
jgi:hypothetical protein